MEVTYSLKRSHLALACFLIEIRRALNYVLCTVAGGGFAAAFTRWESPYAIQGFMLLFAYFFILSWVASVGIGVAVAGLRPGPLLGVLGEHTIEISSEGLREVTAHNRSSHDWRSVIELRKSRFGQLIRIGGGTFHFIPRAAFPTAIDFESFFSSAKQFRAAAYLA